MRSDPESTPPAFGFLSRLSGFPSSGDDFYHSEETRDSIKRVSDGRRLTLHDPRVVLGIGQRTKIDWVEIAWPKPEGLLPFARAAG